MALVKALAVSGPEDRFQAVTIERRDPGPEDVVIDIAYAGICHTDIHRARSEYGETFYPLVPGHEIAGTISEVGTNVTRFSVGDRVGVGCMVDSCRECENCSAGREQYCDTGHTLTYNSLGRDGRRTQGGYSQKIVVDEHFVLLIPKGIPLANAAPLLCAGITTFSPLKHWHAEPGSRVGVIGFGGLGHIATQLSRAFGAHTVVLDLDDEKRSDSIRMGAENFVDVSDSANLGKLTNYFDLLISTVPGNVDLDAYLGLLRTNGTFVNLGVPPRPLTAGAFSLLHHRRSISGSLIGGIAETQEMLDFCEEHHVQAEVSIIDASQVDEAFVRILAGDVRYRFVIDVRTLT